MCSSDQMFTSVLSALSLQTASKYIGNLVSQCFFTGHPDYSKSHVMKLEVSFGYHLFLQIFVGKTLNMV